MVQEMKNALFIAYNVEVDETTITRALRKRGFTRKKVFMTTFLLRDCDLSYRPSFCHKITRPARERDEPTSQRSRRVE